MKKYLIIIFILLSYNVTFAAKSENPMVNLLDVIAWWVIEMSLKIYLFIFFPILFIIFLIKYFIKRR